MTLIMLLFMLIRPIFHKQLPSIVIKQIFEESRSDVVTRTNKDYKGVIVIYYYNI